MIKQTPPSRELAGSTLRRYAGRVFLAVRGWLAIALTARVLSAAAGTFWARLTGVVFYTRVRAQRLRVSGLVLAIVAVALAVLAAGVLFAPQKAEAGPANTVNFQARLETASGAIAADGNYNVRFKLYDASSGGTLLWTETYLVSSSQGIRTVNGYLTSNLGSLTAFPGSINWGQQLYLTMEIGGTGSSPSWDGEMSPRLPLTSVPSAFAINSYNSSLGYTSSLTVAQPTGGSQTFTVPDQGAAGSYTLLTTNTANSSFIQNQNASAQATSNFWISGTGKAATSLQAPLFDTPSAVTMNIGTSTATAITIGRSGITTTNAGALTSSGLLTASAGLTVASTSTAFTNAAATVLTPKVISLGSNGAIGANTATVDVASAFNITATATNLTFTLPTPTASSTAGRVVYVSNVGSNAFTMYGSVMAAGTTQSFVYNGSAWTTNGSGPSGNYIQNSSSVQAGATFNIGGNGVIGGSLSVSGGATLTGNTTIATTAGNTLSIGNSTGTLTVTGSSASTFVLNGVTVDATEFNRLDGKDAALVDVNDAVSTAIVGTGALNSGTITSGFGTINNADTITGTTLNGTTGINTGAGAGTQRIDASGNLVNIGTYSGSGNITTTGGVLNIQGTGNNYLAGNLGIGVASPQTKLDVNGALSMRYNNVRTYNNVYSWGTNSATQTGTLEIILPNAWNSSMLRFQITGYNYSSTAAWQAIISGYNYSGSSQWINTSAEIRGGAAPFSSIRLAYDSALSKTVLLLGTTSTVWNYPQFSIDEVVAGFGNQDTWGSNYSSAFLTSEANITTVNSPTTTSVAYNTTAFMQGGNSFGTSAILGTNDTQSLTLRTGGTTRLTIDTSGNSTFTGSITAVGVAAGTGAITGTGGLTVTGNASIATAAGNSLTLGNSTGTLTVTGSSASTFVLNGVTVTATQFNLLSGKDTALVDTTDAVNTAITGTGALNAGTITSGFGVINNADTITGTTLNGTTGINTGAGAGTQRIDASGNLVNIGTITSGAITSSSTIQGTRIISTVATGTAPLTVASTTLVANLNADLLDGLDSTAFATATGATGYIQNQNASAQTTANFWISGNGRMDGTLTVGGAAQFNGDLTIATGKTLTIGGSNVYGTINIANHATGGAIGTAAATVDVSSAFIVTQTTAGQTLSIPNPTVTTGNRIIYITSASGNANFTIAGVTLTAGQTATFIWNPNSSTWTLSMTTGIGTNTIGTLDTFTNAPNGATISGSVLYLQSASTSVPGLVNTTTQSFAGAKTFTGAVSATLGSGTGLAVTANATIGGTLAVTGAVTGGTYNGQTISSTASFTGTVTAATSVSAPRLISTVATGTAPLTVTSTTVVTNLNADMVDGFHATGFVQNQNASAQTTANFWISGNGRMDGSLTVGGGASIQGNTTIATTAGNTLSIGNSTGTLTVTGSSASTFVLNGVTVTATQFNLLSGKDTALVDTTDAVNTAITGTGALNAGTITSGFGVINNADTITGTTLNGTTGINTGAGAGTQRIDASGNLVNIGTLNASGAVTSSSTIQGTRLISTVATGTAPLTVTSTTVVTNLNADMLDGFHASSFATATGATGYIQNQNASAQTTANFWISGNGRMDGTLTVGGLATFNGDLTIASGKTLTIGGDTVYSTLNIANHATGGAIGTAATTVDVSSAFIVTQTTAGQTLTIPNPTVTTGNRIIYITSASGNADFTIGGVLLTAGQTATFIWNPNNSSWTLSMTSGIGTNTIGTLDTFTNAANGGTISGSILYLQSASTSVPGLVNTTTQSFAGAKTFTGAVSATLASGTGLAVTANATIGGTLAVTGAVTGGTYNGQTISSTASFTGTVTAATSLSAPRLISTVATGTAPLTVTSTTVVTNLNADMVDGLHASSFAPTTGGTGYIQNQNASAQTTANFWISGSGRVDGGLTVAGGASIQGNTTIATTAGNTLSIGNSTGNLTVTGSSASTFNINGVVISATEFNLLNGRDTALVDTTDAVHTAITGTGILNSGSIASGFGTINIGNTITGTTLNGTTGINTGAGAGTQRIDASGNLVNIGTISSGAITSSGSIQGTSFTSTVTTGTAPLTVASTTLVTNLNADLLDGFHASSFATATGATGYIQNQNASAQTTANFWISGNGRMDGTLTVGGLATFNGDLTIASGKTLTIGGDTVYSTIAIANHSSNGPIGTAAATVDISSAFIITQNSPNRTLTIPSPTVTTGNRIIYITSASGNVDVTIGGVLLTAGQTATFVWNPDASTWSISMTTGIGTNTIGALDTFTNAVNGGTISGSVLYLQSASTSVPGLVNTGTQSFAGAKTFNTGAANTLSVTSSTTVPTADQLSISNTGSTGVTTAGVNGLSIAYKGGAAAVEAAGARIDLQPGTTSGGIWSGMRIVPNATGAVAGVTEYGLKLDNLTTPGAGTESALYVGTGWDNILQSTNFTVTQAGAITAVGVNSGSGLIQGTGGLTVTGTVRAASLTTNGIVMTSGGNGTLTVASTLGVANGGTGVNGSTAANGSLLIGNGSGYTLATLTQGSNISISNAAGSITVATTQNPTFNTSVTTGVASSTTGQLKFANSASANLLTVVSGAMSNGAATLTIPTVGASYLSTEEVCLRYTANCGGVAGSIGTFDTFTNAANGATISGNFLYLQSASTSVPGLVNTGVQSFAGAKTFTGSVTSSSTITGTTLNGTTGINTGAGAGTQRIDASGNLVNITSVKSTGTGTLNIDSGSAGGTVTIGTNATTVNVGTSGSTTITQGNSTSTTTVKLQGGANYMYVSNSGIGINTTSPVTALDVNGALSMRYNNVRTYNNVYSWGTTTASQTGTLEIILPNGWNNTMLRFQITGYNYSGTASWQAVVSGYNAASGPSWNNASAEIRGGPAPFSSIRLAYDTALSKTVLLLGTTSTTWNYPQFSVDQVVAGYSNQDTWGSGYSSAFLASEANISNINSPTTASVLYSTTAFVQGGNSFGAAAVLGTNDSQDLTLRTNGSTRLTINATTGNSTFTGSITSVGVNSGSGLIQGTGGLTVSGAIRFSTLTTNGIVTTTSGNGTIAVIASLPVSQGGTGLTATPSNGQLPIGNGTGYTLATLTQGSNMSITNGSGSITVATVMNPNFTTSVTTPLLQSAAGTALTVTGGTTLSLQTTGANAINLLTNGTGRLWIDGTGASTFSGSLSVAGGITTTGGQNNVLIASSGAPTDAGDLIFQSNAGVEYGRVWTQNGGGLCLSGSTAPGCAINVLNTGGAVITGGTDPVIINNGSTATTTNIGISTGTNAVNIGTNTTSAATITEGSSNAGTTVKLQAGATVVNVTNANALVTSTIFQVQDAGGISLLNADTTNKRLTVGNGTFVNGQLTMAGLQSAGTFTTADAAAPYLDNERVVVADFDGDGRKDYATFAYNNPAGWCSVTIYINNGDGLTYTAKNTIGSLYGSLGSAASCKFSFSAADVDGDGDIDLLYDTDYQLVGVLTNDGNGNLSSATTVTSGTSVYGTTASRFVDIDGDGDQDIVTRGRNNTGPTYPVTVFKNNGSGTFSNFSSTNISAATAYQPMEFADVDGDGDKDAILTNGTSIGIMKNNGSGTLAAMSTYGTLVNAKDVGYGDFDGDGDQDIVVTDRNGSNTYVYTLRNNGSGVYSTWYTIASTLDSDVQLTVADMDNDGRSDVVLTKDSVTTGTVTVILNKNISSGAFYTASTYSAPSGNATNDVAVGDMNNDGLQDIVAAATGASSAVATKIYLSTYVAPIARAANTAALSVTSTNAATGGIYVRGSTNQAAPLVDIQDSTGTSVLTVAGSSTAGYALTVSNNSTSTSSDGILINLGVTAANRSSSNYYAAFAAAGTVTGKIQSSSSTAVAYTTTGADYAEYFRANPADLPVPGELVALDVTKPNGVRRATSNDTITGVVSTAPGFIGNGPICQVEDENCDSDYAKYNVLVSLTGQVPLKTNVEGGVIHIGDAIGASSVSGVAAKASGRNIVGYALTEPDADGIIQVLIDVANFDPTKDLQASGVVAETLTLTGNAHIGGNLNVSGLTTLHDLAVTGGATIDGDLTVTGIANVGTLKVGNHILSNSTTPLVAIGSSAGQDGLATIDGTDVAGTLNVTVKAHQQDGVTEALNAGPLANVTFNKPFEFTPRIVISPTNDASVGAQVYLIKTNTGYQLVIKQAPVDGTQYQFDYIVIGSNGQTANAGP